MPSTMPRGFLFDVEGTLVDCVPATLHAWRETLRDADLYFSIEQLHRHSGQDPHEMLRALLPPEKLRLADNLISEQGKRYRDHYLHRLRLYQGRADGAVDREHERRTEAYDRLRRELLEAEHGAVVRLRNEEGLDVFLDESELVVREGAGLFDICVKSELHGRG